MDKLTQTNRVLANDRLRLSITNACNFRCSYCTNEGQRDRSGIMLNMRFLENLIKAIKYESIYVRKMNITGGEPLLHPYIRDIISSCIDISESVTLNTNGYLLTHKDIDDYHQLGLANIKFGIDSFTTDATKPSSSIGRERTAEIIEKLLHACELMPRSSANIVLSDYNMEEINWMLDFIMEKKIDKVEVLELIQHPFRDIEITTSAKLLALMAMRTQQLSRITYNPKLAKFICYTPDGMTIQFAQDFCLHRVCQNLWTRVSAEGGLLPCIKAGEQYRIDFSRSLTEQIQNCNNLMCNALKSHIPRYIDGKLYYSTTENAIPPTPPVQFDIQSLGFAVEITGMDP